MNEATVPCWCGFQTLVLCVVRIVITKYEAFDGVST